MSKYYTSIVQNTDVLRSPHLLSSGPQKCSACIKEDLFEESVSFLKQGGVSISSLSTYWFGGINCIVIIGNSIDSCGAKCICKGSVCIDMRGRNQRCVFYQDWPLHHHVAKNATRAEKNSLICCTYTHSDCKLCAKCSQAWGLTATSLCRLFLTMQLGERWKPWQLFVQMKDARGREQLKSLRYTLQKIEQEGCPILFSILHWFRLFHKCSGFAFADMVSPDHCLNVYHTYLVICCAQQIKRQSRKHVYCQAGSKLARIWLWWGCHFRGQQNRKLHTYTVCQTYKEKKGTNSWTTPQPTPPYLEIHMFPGQPRGILWLHDHPVPFLQRVNESQRTGTP